MTDIDICPRCGNNCIAESQKIICGISVQYEIECCVCGYTVQKATKRGAYKAWEKECKEVYGR